MIWVFPWIPCESSPGIYNLAISQDVCCTSPCSPIHRIKCNPLFYCSSPASSFPAYNARVVFKTNENGTQEAKWIHLALHYPLPCCYLFLCISLEATFVNMAAEKPQARENWFFLYETNNLSSTGAVLNKAAIWKAEKCKLVSSCIVCSSCLSTQRKKCDGAGKAQMVIYRNSWTATTWPSHSRLHS